MKKTIFICIFLVSLFIINNLVRSIYNLYQKQDLVVKTQQQLARKKAENQQLQVQLKQVNSTSFLEEQARNKLFLGKPGESLVVIAKPTVIPTPEDNTQQKKKLAPWEQWWQLFF